jgi:hypothetical protein
MLKQQLHRHDGFKTANTSKDHLRILRFMCLTTHRDV